LISGNESIIELVLQLTQIAAILSVVFLLLSHFEEKRNLLLTTLAVIFLTTSGILFWIEELNYIGIWLWQTLAAAGVGLLSYTLTNFYNSNSSINRYGHF
jgi:Na+/melibiose symporter-like transporter